MLPLPSFRAAMRTCIPAIVTGELLSQRLDVAFAGTNLPVGSWRVPQVPSSRRCWSESSMLPLPCFRAEMRTCKLSS